MISEFGNIDEIVNEMEIQVNPIHENHMPVVPLEQAKQFIEIKQSTSRIIGIGVSHYYICRCNDK
ncbi:MAG: hypothetical protein ACERKZ_09480 [Lachnotalea sp.]